MPRQPKIDWATVLIAASANLVPSAVVATLGIALPELRQALALSEVEAGSLFSVIFVVAAIASAAAGRMADRAGRKTVLLVGIGGASVGFALAGLSFAYPLMLLFLACTGLGYGFTTPSLYALMSDLMPGRRGLATSLVSVAYGIGGSMGAVVSSALVARAGWRAAFLAVGGFGLGIMSLEAIRIKARAAFAATRATLSFRKSINRSMVILAMAEFFGGAVFWSSASWTPTVLRSAKELSLQETGLVMGVWALTPMIGALLLGAASDRFGRKAVIVSSALPGAVIAFVVYAWLASPLSLALGLGLLGILKATIPTLIVALAQDATSAESAGTASGVIMCMHYVSAVVAPLIAAQLIASTGDMILTMILTSSLPLIVFGALITAVEEKRAVRA